MKTSFWAPYISDHTIHAICWTLIHSLWIGLAIALLAGLVITITRKSSAALRYNLLCGILVLFTISVYVTFWTEMRTSAVAQGPSHLGQIVFAPDNHIVIVPATTAPNLSLFTRVVWLLNEYSNVIFLTWLLFFVLKSLKMAGGLLYIQRIRNYKVHEVSEEFKNRIDLFASQIGISQTVKLMQSELVKVPVAVGWLKPMILLPMGVILQLPAEQVESILWHELAHIRRRDYLVNILQGLVETVFFFNPGLLWLSSLIRAEREACCDDIVLSRMQRKANYLEALLAVADKNNRYMSLAMGIGSGSQLRDRMKRMISQENKRLSMAEKIVLIIGLVALSAFTSLPKTTQAAVKHLVNVVINKTDRPAAHNKTVTYSTTKQRGVQQEIELAIADTVHRKSNPMAGFRSVLFKNTDADLANNDISAVDTSGKTYHFIVADNKLVSMEINGEKVSENDLPKYQYLITQIDIAVVEKRHIREQDIADFKADNPAAARFKTNRGFDKHNADSMRVKALGDIHWRLKLDSLKAKNFNGRTKMDEMDKVNWKLEAMRDRARQDSLSYADQKDRALNVIADLVHDKVLANPAAIKWFGLSDTEFIVNGQKQPDELQQKYKAKYNISPGNGLYYGPVQMHGTGVFIDITDNKPPLPPRGQRPPKTAREFGFAQPKFQSQQFKIQQFKQQQLFSEKQLKANLFKDQQSKFKLDSQTYKNQLLKSRQLLSKDQTLRLQFRDMQTFKPKYMSPGVPLDDIMANITDDLVNANVLKDKNELVKFNLTNSALMVNGVKQSDELHEKLKAKYLQRPNYQINDNLASKPYFGLHFNSQTGNMGLGITDGPDSP